MLQNQSTYQYFENDSEKEEDASPSHRKHRLSQNFFSLTTEGLPLYIKKFEKSTNKLRNFLSWIDVPKKTPTISFYEDLKKFKFLGEEKQEKFIQDQNIEINCIFISSDLKHLAVGNDSDPIHIWDLHEETMLLLGEDSYECFALLMTDDFLYYSGHTKNIFKYQISLKKNVSKFEGPISTVFSLAFNEREEILASGDHDANIFIWNTNFPEKSQKISNAHTSPIHLITMTKLNKHLISASKDKLIKIWDLNDLSLLYVFEKASKNITCLSLSNKEDFLCSGSECGTIYLWDIQTKELVYYFNEHQDKIAGLSFSSNDSYIISASYDNTIKYWDVQTKKLINEEVLDDEFNKVDLMLYRHETDTLITEVMGKIKIQNIQKLFDEDMKQGTKDEVLALCALPKLNMVITGGKDQVIRVWNIVHKKVVTQIMDHNHSITSIEATKSGKFFASGDESGLINLWSSQNFTKTESFHMHTKRINFIRFNESVGLMISAALDRTILAVKYSKGIVENFHVQLNNDAPVDVQFSIDKEENSIRGLSNDVVAFEMISEHSSFVFYLKEDTKITLISIETFKIKGNFTLPEEKYSICSIKYSKKTSNLLAGCHNGQILIWSFASNELIRNFSINFQILSMEFNYKKLVIITSNDDAFIRMWHMETGERIHKIDTEGKNIKQLILTPDNTTLILANTKSAAISPIYLKKLQTKHLFKHVKSDGEVDALVLSADKKILAVGLSDGLISLYEMTNYTFISDLEGHVLSVKCMKFSADSKLLYSGGDDSTLRIWNIESRSEIVKTKELSGTINALSIFANGQKIIICSSDNSITILSSQNLEKIDSFHLVSNLKDLVLSKDEKVCYASHANSINKFRIEGDKIELMFTKDKAHSNTIYTLALSTKHLFSAGKDKKIKIWSLESINLEFVTELNAPSFILSIAINENETVLYSGLYDSQIFLWDLINYKKISVFEGHRNSIKKICVADNFLYSGSQDKTVRIWELENFKPISFIQGHHDRINAMAISSNMNILITGSNDEMIIWNLMENKIKKIIKTESSIDQILFLKDNIRFITLMRKEKNGVRLYFADGTLLHKQTRAVFPCSMIATRDEKNIIVSCNNGKIYFWDLMSNKYDEKILDEHFCAVYAMVLNKDGSKLFSGADDNLIIIWDLFTNKPLHTLRGHKKGITILKLNSYDTLLISGAADKQLLIWDLKSLSIIKSIRFEFSITDLVLTSDDSYFILSLASNFGPKLYAYSLKNFESLPWFKEIGKGNSKLILTKNDTTLITGDDKNINFINLTTKKMEKKFLGYSRHICCQEVSFENNCLALADLDNKITLWNIKEKKIDGYLEGHEDHISGMTFTAKNNLISCSWDKMIFVWDLVFFECIAKMEGHSNRIFQIILMKYDVLASCGGDHYIRIWDINEHRQQAKVKFYEDLAFSIFSIPNTNKLYIGTKNGYLKILDFDEIKKPPMIVAKLKSSIFRLKLSPDSKILAVILENNTLQILETYNYTVLSEYGNHFPNLNFQLPIFLSFSQSRIAIYYGKLIDCYTGQIIFEFLQDEKIMSFFFHSNTQTYLYISPEFELFKFKKENFKDQLFHALNHDSLLNPHNKKDICERKMSIFPYFFSFMHLIAIFEKNENFTKEKVNLLFKKPKHKLFLPKLYQLDIFNFTPLDILIEKRNITSTLKYLKIVFEAFKKKTSTFYDKTRFLIYEFRENYSLMHLLCDLLPMIGDDLYIIDLLFKNSLIPFDPSIYNNDLTFNDLAEPLIIETDSIYIDKQELLNSLENEFKNSKLKENQSILKSHLICLPNITDLTNSKTVEFFSLLNHLEIDNPFFKNEILQKIVDYVWTKQIAVLYSNEFFVYFFFFLVFNYKTFIVFFNNEVWISVLVSEFILLIYGIFCLINEFNQYLQSSYYFKSIWNYVDIILIPCMIGSASLNIYYEILVGINVATLKYVSVFFSFSMFFFWLRLLSYSRGFKNTSHMIRLIFNVISGVKYFVLFMIFFMFAFASSFFLLREYDQDRVFSNFMATLLAFYQSAVGNTEDILSIPLSFDSYLNELFMIIASFVFAIISMNLLVSIIGDEHSKNKENENSNRVFELINLIVDVESSFLAKITKRCLKRNNKKFLIEVFNEEQIKDKEKLDEILNHLKQIKDSNKNLSKAMMHFEVNDKLGKPKI